MVTKNKILQSIFFSFISIIIFLLAINFTLKIFLPQITSIINKTGKNFISYHKIDLKLFPYPGLRLTNLKIKKEKVVDLRFKTIDVFLNFLGVTSHDFLGIKANSGTIFVYGLTFPQKKQNKPFSIPKVPVEFIDLSNVNINIQLNGKLLKFQKTYTTIFLKNESILIESRGTSNLTKSFNIKVAISKYKKKIKTKLSELNINKIIKILPQKHHQFKDISGLINTNLDIEIGDQQITAKVDIFSKELVIGKKIEGIDLKFVALIDSKTHLNKVIIKKFYTNYPYIQLTGQGEISANKTNIQITGHKIDITDLRKVYKKFPLKNNIVNTVFSIVKTGILLNSSFSLTTLDQTTKWTLEGECADTDVLIPGIELPLQRISGKIKIKNNVLMCREIKGFYRKSIIQNGYLDLGLNENLTPFLINAQVYFDLKDLQPLLKKLKVSDKIIHEIEKINIKSGNCNIFFTLNKKLKDYEWKVIAKKIKLNGRLPNIPLMFTSEFFSITKDNINIKNGNINLRKSKLKNINLKVDLFSKKLNLSLNNSKINIKEIKNVFKYFFNFNDKFNFKGNLFLSRAKIDYNYNLNKLEHYLFLGKILDFRIKGLNLKNNLPGKINVSIGGGKFFISPENLKFTSLTIKTLRSKIKLNSLKILGNIKKPASIKVVFSGKMSKEIQKILKTLVPYLKPVKTTDNFYVKKMKFSMIQKAIEVEGDVILNNVFINLKLTKKQEKIATDVDLKYNNTKCNILFNKQNEIFYISFKGRLTHYILNRLLENNLYLKDKIYGNFNLTFSLNPFYIINSNGYLNINSIDIDDDLKLLVIQLSTNSSNNKIIIKNSSIDLFNDKINLFGNILLLKNHTNIDISLISNELHLDPLIKKFNKKKHNTKSQLRLTGNINFQIRNVFYKNWIVKDIIGKILINNGFKELRISRSLFCGLPINLLFKNDKEEKKLDIWMESLNFPIKDTLNCLLCEKKKLITGTSKIKVSLHSNLNNNFIKALNGDFFFKAKDGRIFKLTLISQILSIINSTEIFVGKVPDLEKKGFKYNDLEAKGIVKNGCLIFKNSYLNATNMELAFHGKIDLNTKKVNLVILFAPLKTIDRIVKKIPILRHITGGNLVVIPFQAKGTIDKPIIIPLSPKAVGTEAINILKNTLKLPFTLFQPILGTQK